MMEQRQLGKNGPRVGAIGLGCWGMSGTYGPAEDASSTATIHRALELGTTLIDTADVYGKEGHNERLVGNAIRDRRDKAFLASKFGRIHRPTGANTGQCGTPEYVRSACEASLARLGLETIDLYYYHRVDPQVPVEETVGAMAELVKAGKVRYLGLSEAEPEHIRRAASVHPIAALQSEYSLFTRDMEDNGVIPTIRELGIALVPFYAIGRGWLTDVSHPVASLAPEDGRRRHPRFAEENFAKNLALVERVKALAKRLDVTTAQLALAWVLARGDDFVPIPGTKHVKYVEENAAAAAIKLTPAQLAELEQAIPKGSAAGPRSADPLTRIWSSA